jgi:DNA gyrase subunit A
MTKTDDVRAIGRVARGIRLIKLIEGDVVVAAKLIRQNAKELISVSRNGYIKSSNVSEFSLQGKNTKGSKIQKLYDGDVMADFLPVHDLNEIIVVATKTAIKFKKDEVPTVLKGAYGVRSMKIAEGNNVITLD